MSIRIGFIGTGGIAAKHLRNIVAMDDVEVAGMCDVSLKQIEATKARISAGGGSAKSLSDARSYVDFTVMLKRESLDAVYVCLPPWVHGEAEEAVIEAGVPMLVEKPVALDLKVAGRILGGIRDKGLIAATGYQMRYRPDIEMVKDRLQDCKIGMVTVMRFGGTPGKPWYIRQEKSGGQLIEMATHELDILRYLVGDLETIYAQADTRINNESNPEYNIFDVNCMTMRFENGVVGNFSNNFICDQGAPDRAQGIHIMTGDLTISIVSGQASSVRTRAGIEELPEPGNFMALEDAAFLQAVRENRPDLIRSDYENGVRSLAATLASDLSARSGEVIHVGEFLARQLPSL